MCVTCVIIIFFRSYSLSLSLDSRESLCSPPYPGHFIMYDFAKKPFLNKRIRKPLLTPESINVQQVFDNRIMRTLQNAP